MSDEGSSGASDDSTDSRWISRTEWAAVPELELVGAGGAPGAVLVVVAHPDDETLAVGGLICAAREHGVPVHVVVATAGEASHPASPTLSPTDLARVRRAELAAALHALDEGVSHEVLGLPDGAVTGHRTELAAAVRAHAEPTCLLVSTWREDGHPDHRAVALAVADVARELGARHLQAPIWGWVWGDPERFPWPQAHRVSLTAAQQARKAAALAAYRSQLEPLSPHPGDETVVPPEVVEHFRRSWETVLELPAADAAVDTAGDPAVDTAGDPAVDTAGDPAVDTAGDPARPVAHPAAALDAMYDQGSDPWRFASSWYEHRKRALALASLPSLRLGRVLEIGPANGWVTVRLAERAGEVTAVDVSSRAVDTARATVAEAGLSERVRLLVGRMPQDWPPGEFDTVVISEIAYFLDESDWLEVLEQARACLAPEGALLLVHWAHPVSGPLDGVRADSLAEGLDGMTTTVRHVEPDFVLRVLRRMGLPSIAALEGRV